MSDNSEKGLYKPKLDITVSQVESIIVEHFTKQGLDVVGLKFNVSGDHYYKSTFSGVTLTLQVEAKER